MTDPKKKRGRGRPPGSPNRPKPKRPLRELLAEDFTEKDVKKLSPAQRARLLAALEPKARPTPEDKVIVNFSIRGLDDRATACPKCGFALDRERGSEPAPSPPPPEPGPTDFRAPRPFRMKAEEKKQQAEQTPEAKNREEQARLREELEERLRAIREEYQPIPDWQRPLK